MSISDWSSDVCSSDLQAVADLRRGRHFGMPDGKAGHLMGTVVGETVPGQTSQLFPAVEHDRARRGPVRTRSGSHCGDPSMVRLRRRLACLVEARVKRFQGGSASSFCGGAMGERVAAGKCTSQKKPCCLNGL